MNLLRDRVMHMLAGMSVHYGKAYAKERVKRERISGKRPGERSISRVERQLAKQGRLIRKRVMPGGRLPNGYTTTKGTVIVTLVTRQVARAKARASRKAERRKLSPAPRSEPRQSRPAEWPPVSVAVDRTQGQANSASAIEILRMLGPPSSAK